MTNLSVTIEKDMKVIEVLRKNPRTIAVFNRHGIEACCCGQRSLEAVAAERNIDLSELMESLKRAG